MARGKKDFSKAALADVAPVDKERDEAPTGLPAKRLGERPGTDRLSGARLIALDRLRLDEQRLRQSMDGRSLQKLADSIKQHGVIHPITVEYDEAEDVYRIITGARRFAAAQKAGLSSAPCIIREQPAASNRVQQLIENIHREDLPVLDEAEAIHELCIAFKLSQREVARRIGKPKTYVNELLMIVRLPEEVKQELRRGVPIPKSSLVKLARVKTAAALPALVQQLTEQRLSTKELGQQCDTAKPRPRGRPAYHEFSYHAADGSYRLTIRFRKSRVAPGDVQKALAQTLETLQ